MNDLISLTPQAFSLTVDFIKFFIAIIAIIFSLRIVWRVEKKLDIFFKLMTAAFFIFLVRDGIRILQDLDIISGKNIFPILDIMPILLITLALVVMNSLISKLDGEKDH